MAKQITVRTKSGRSLSYEWADSGTIYRGSSWGGIRVGSAKTLEDAIAVSKSDAQQHTGNPVERVDVR